MDSGGGGGGGGVTAISVPYRHLRDAEMELVSLNSNNGPNSPRARASGVPPPHKDRPPRQQQEEEEQNGATERTKRSTAKYRVVLACMVAAGVQFAWAFQLSLLTPYIQIPIQPSRRRKEDKLYKELEEMKEAIVGKCLPLLPPPSSCSSPSGWCHREPARLFFILVEKHPRRMPSFLRWGSSSIPALLETAGEVVSHLRHASTGSGDNRLDRANSM